MKDTKPAILMLIAFTVICGGIYPAVVTGIAQVVFPEQANGSFITGNRGKIVGSSLIGQPFSAAKYFWPRPSATGGFPYNPTASGGSNYGPTNPANLETAAVRVKTLRAAGISASIPSDLVQASASGLDPHLSPEAAKVQIPRVAAARGLREGEVARFVDANTEGRQLGFLGEPRVNVLKLNLELDNLP